MNNTALVDQTATAADLFNLLSDEAQEQILEVMRQLVRKNEEEAEAQRRG